jgi:hypothetical protein
VHPFGARTVRRRVHNVLESCLPRPSPPRAHPLLPGSEHLDEASPIIERGTVTGYLSVRFKADRSAIDAASKLYKSMNDGTAKGVALRGGKVVRTGWLAAATRRLTDGSIKWRLVMLIVMLSVVHKERSAGS